jgi:hypothetical protein
MPVFQKLGIDVARDIKSQHVAIDARFRGLTLARIVWKPRDCQPRGTSGCCMRLNVESPDRSTPFKVYAV